MTNEYNPDGKEIRFIDSHYKDLFHIPDGSCVQIHYPDEMVVKPCTFIDEYHTQIGYNVFHICQFAEIMERNGASYMPEPEIMGDEAAWKVGKDRIEYVPVAGARASATSAVRRDVSDRETERLSSIN
ncbi:MAG: hypothetical protein ACLUGI_03685 [Subdoligranulum sp.]